MSCAKYNLKIKQGTTYSKAASELGGGKVCKLIENLAPGCPTLITITGHGLPVGAELPVYVSHVQGATRANTKNNSTVVATYVDANSFFIDADTVAQDYTTTSGLVTYYAPSDLTNYTARMHIREEVDSPTTIWEGSTGTGEITINASLGKVTFTIPASVTATFDFDSAVYDLEIVDDSVEPVVTRILEGTVELCDEVTR